MPLLNGSRLTFELLKTKLESSGVSDWKSPFYPRRRRGCEQEDRLTFTHQEQSRTSDTDSDRPVPDTYSTGDQTGRTLIHECRPLLFSLSTKARRTTWTPKHQKERICFHGNLNSLSSHTHCSQQLQMETNHIYKNHIFLIKYCKLSYDKVC